MSIEVFLDNYGGACYPGQTIAGRLECTFNKEKNLRTEWHESESYYDHSSKKHRTRRVRYSAEEVYFDAEYVLVQENFILPAGKHSYPFSYILPPQLPSSFEGTYGHVRYSIKGTVDRPWKFDYEAKIGLNVISPLDLNFIPGLREPIAMSVDKNLCCCWCKSGPLTFDISVPATGFCPDEDVNVGACVQNMSNVSVENVVFKIYKHVEFISHFPSTHHRYDEILVAECQESGIGAHGEHSWTSKLKIPTNITYPNLVPCSIMNISYELKGKAVLPCPHTNLTTTFPIMIGSIPLSGVQLSGVPGGPPPSEFPLPTYNQMPNSIGPYPPGHILGGATAPPGDATPLLQYVDNDKHLPEKHALDGLPYPTNNMQAPSNQGGTVPYAPSSTGAPYPSAGAPYPSAGAPYPSAGAPYPSAGAPYPSSGGPYPQSVGAGTPYPVGASVPYPASAPYSTDTIGMAPPSYDESVKTNEKSEKY
ncbi:hypothetical protein RI129_012151 [Pyrocoelia pectoralis]|uniref:Arrestin C-terminal-like domain-containing protein n=1 Tax=Pyrocoelia pectoralis TaxID=417401 RepID=A0AAN7V9A6_9COLE